MLAHIRAGTAHIRAGTTERAHGCKVGEPLVGALEGAPVGEYVGITEGCCVAFKYLSSWAIASGSAACLAH